MPQRSPLPLLQGGFRAGGRRDVPGGLPVRVPVGERAAAGEALSVPGCGGDAPGEGDLAEVGFFLRGAGAAL